MANTFTGQPVIVKGNDRTIKQSHWVCQAYHSTTLVIRLFENTGQ